MGQTACMGDRFQERSMDAHEVNALREEVTAVLAVAKPGDPGGCASGKPRWRCAWLWHGGIAIAAPAR